MFVRARASARDRLQLLDALLHRGSFLVGEPTTCPDGERPPCHARNSAAWSVAHWRNVRGGAPVSSANVDVTNAG
jgi:hypothetical protein